MFNLKTTSILFSSVVGSKKQLIFLLVSLPDKVNNKLPSDVSSIVNVPSASEKSAFVFIPSALRSPVIARSHARDLLEGLIEIGEIPEAAGLRYLKDRDIVFPKQADRALDTLQKQIFIRRNSGHAPENRRKMRAAHTGAPGDVVERQLYLPRLPGFRQRQLRNRFKKVAV